MQYGRDGSAAPQEDEEEPRRQENASTRQEKRVTEEPKPPMKVAASKRDAEIAGSDDSGEDGDGFFRVDFSKMGGGKKRGRVDMEEEILSDEASMNGDAAQDDGDEIPSAEISGSSDGESDEEAQSAPAPKRRRADEEGSYRVDPAALDRFERDQAADIALMKRLEKKMKKSKEADEFDFLLKGIAAGSGNLIKAQPPKSREEYVNAVPRTG